MALDILLVKKAQKGDQEAFITLVQGYEGKLYNMAYRFLKNEHDVADVLQETIIKAYQRVGQLKKPKYFNTWLTRILINECKTFLDKQNRRVEDFAAVETLVASEGVPVGETLLEMLLAELNESYRTTLVLHYYGGFSITEISEITDEPEGTIKSRLSRGRALLKKEYLKLEGI